MAFADLFQIYPNYNPELRMIAKVAYEYGRNIAESPSAAATIGVLDHEIKRQDQYISRMNDMVDSLHDKPIPDKPQVHATGYDIHLDEEYPMFQTDVNGNEVPLNEFTELVAIKWMEFAVELAMSNSAAIPGGLIDFDHIRARNNLAVLGKLMDEFRNRPMIDVPETAEPGAPLKVRGKK